MSSVAIHSMEQELKWLDNYLNLQRLIVKSELDYTILVEEGISLDKIEIPALLLQPIVENSIKHGFLQGSQAEKVDIFLAKKSDHYLLTITDDGQGRHNQNAVSTKVGLKNIENRIKVFSKLTGNRIDVHAGPVSIRGYQTSLKFYFHA